jgi:hypothetical protein
MAVPEHDLLQVKHHKDPNHAGAVEHICKSTLAPKHLDNHPFFFDLKGAVQCPSCKPHHRGNKTID